MIYCNIKIFCIMVKSKVKLEKDWIEATKGIVQCVWLVLVYREFFFFAFWALDLEFLERMGVVSGDVRDDAEIWKLKRVRFWCGKWEVKWSKGRLFLIGTKKWDSNGKG